MKTISLASAVPFLAIMVAVSGQTAPVALVRHAPTLNGTVEGSIQQMAAESVTLNGAAAVTGDLFVPGTPAIRLNGKPLLGGTVTGIGAATPSNFTVTLNGNSRLGRLRTRTDPLELPVASAPPPASGNRNVSINHGGQSAGDFATLRNLTLNGNVGQFPVPPGTYGDFTANGNSGFTLGVAGANQPTVYAFQHLTLNGNAVLDVASPVVVTIAQGLSINGRIGAESHPDWLMLRVAAGGVTLNGNVTVAGFINAPTGTVTINGNSRLVGGVVSDRLVLNGNAVLQLVNLAPVVTLASPGDGEVFATSAPTLVLRADASDLDGFVTRVEFFAGDTKVGESSTAPFEFAWSNVASGRYSLTARATDNAGVSATSAPALVTINAPPTIALAEPANGTIIAASSSLALVAVAADSDGHVAKVEFFSGGGKLGEVLAAPYQFVVPSLSPGAHTYFARATDDRGAVANSESVSIFAEVPPEASLAAPATVSLGSEVMLTASASDTDGVVARVDFFRDGVLIGSVADPSGVPPAYEFADASALKPGNYTYTVRVYDDQGLYADAAPVDVAILPTLPYAADFETGEGYAAGSLDHQLGWIVESGTARVVDDAAFSGTHSVLLAPGTPPTRVLRTFAPLADHEIVFVDLASQPAVGSTPADSTIFDADVARFGFLHAGTDAVLQAFAGDGAGGGQWQPSGFVVPLNAEDQTQDWVRLTARLDFSRQVWDLYAGGKMVAADVTFRDGASGYLSSLGIQGSATTAGRVDFLYAGADNPLFADANNDGIDDSWEIEHGLSLETNNRDLAPAGNGVRVVESYVRGTDPNDYYQGETPTLAKINGDNQIAPPGQFNPLPFEVSLLDRDGMTALGNAPVVFSVAQGGGQLAASNSGVPSVASTLAVRTDAAGTAQAFYQQPATANVASQISVCAGAATVAFDTSSAESMNDIDGNGLPDDWENAHFGHAAVDPNADEDGDGLSNLQEYQNGGDPTDFYNGSAPVFASLVNPTPLSVRVAGYNGQSAGPILLSTEDDSAESRQLARSGNASDLSARTSPVASRDAPSTGISVLLTGPDGNPLVNAPVKFEVLGGSTSIAANPGDNGASSVTVRTDEGGIARIVVVSLGEPAGNLVVSPQGGANLSGSLVASTYAAIDLGIYTWPIGIAKDGTVTFWNDWDLSRWRNGVVSSLDVPDSIYRFNTVNGNGYEHENYAEDPLWNFIPEFGLGFLTRDGAVVSYASDLALQQFNRSWEDFIVVWGKDSTDPVTIKGPLIHEDFVAVYGDNWGTSNYSGAFPMAATGSEIWGHLGDDRPLRFAGGGAQSWAFSEADLAPVFHDVNDHYALSVEDVNESHQAVGGYYDWEGNLKYFVGTPAQVVNFVPFAINDAEQVLGDDYDPDRDDSYYYSIGSNYQTEPTAVLTKPDAYTSATLQSALGHEAQHPFVYSEGTKHYLQVPPGTNAIRIVGLDESGNVYGSLNPKYPGNVNVGQNVIWIANPISWGLSAATRKYSPMLWEQPNLPSGATALGGVLPGANRIQTTYVLGTGAESDGYRGQILVPLGMAVDGNRDGQIEVAGENGSDVTTASRPFRFWLNDDSDSGEEKSSSLDDLPVSSTTSGRNSDDDHVNGIRDLVDFFPVYLDVKQLLAALPPDTNGMSYYLKQEDAALGIVFTSYTRAQAFDYLRGAPSNLDTGFGPSLSQKAGEATVTKLTAAGIDLFATSPGFRARIQNSDGGVILVEASKASTKPLVLEVRKGAKVIATVQLAIRTDLVETMFRYHNIRSQAHGTAIAADNRGPNYGATMPSDAPNDPFQNVANRKNVVFVHGYNMNSKQAQGSASEVFKRLYWSGSKAKFYAVLWRGDDGQGEDIAPAGVTPDYHRNVGHAWQQGPYLRDLLTSLTGEAAVIAHSLGNVVTQVALTYERDPSNAARLRPAARPAGVKNYFAIDAALPLEALDVASITTSSKALMRHPDWAEYDTQERLWPTQWYALFTGTSDGRNGLTWRNVFAGLDVGTNLYSSGEEVLANPINDSVPLWEPLFGGGLRAWVSQEKHKGGAGLAASFFRSWTGGWIENKAWYVPIGPTPPAGSPQTRRRFVSEAQDVAAPGGVPSSTLPSEPFFQRFQANESGGFYPGYQGSRLHAPIGDANADDEARKLVTVAKCLGEAIPALSFPQGSNASPAFTRPGMSGNFDLNSSTFKNGWPSSRSDANWKHSDCLNVAYTFNFPLYDKMANDGGLK
ncbi:MAG TPA: Ig-like domain-containing protein [Opitutus sp.]|nr:Ig-like domain-containing protein [Opitutus sp.]